ncbi:MAG: magnesium-dependent phosphatase-1 [Thermoprotei archaeon]|nr:magnesium-dependent phosphatase-1 [Thermoprotei archaeon]
MSCWILFVDLDGTLWDNLDISMLDPPFRGVSEGVIADSRGVKVRLYVDMVRLIEEARRCGAFVSALSWNVREKALEALRAFNVINLFDYLAIEPHPDKGLMALGALEEASRRGCSEPCTIVYIDDRDIHLESVRRRIGDSFKFLRAWRDFRGLEDALEILRNILADACPNVRLNCSL